MQKCIGQSLVARCFFGGAASRVDPAACRAEGGIGMAKATAARRSALHRAAATGRALPPAVAQGDGTKRDADALLDQLLVFALAHHPRTVIALDGLDRPV